MSVRELSPATIPSTNGHSSHEVSNKVLVVTPAYNEARFIGSVVIKAKMLGFKIMVVDDGSTDDTAEIAAAAGALVERHSRNKGKAEALNTAFQFARNSGVEVLVVIDGDGQHDVKEIHHVLEPVLKGEADLVIGSRFLKQSTGKIPKVRRLGQEAITIATNAGSGVPVTDSQSGYRAFSRRAIESLLFNSNNQQGEVEMLFQARNYGLRVKEIAIQAIYTDPPKRNVFGHGLHVLDGILKLIGRHRPLLFFGVPGVLFLAIALVLGIVIINTYQRSQELAVGYAMITLLFSLAGMLSLITGFLLHSVRSVFIDLEKRLIDLYWSVNNKQPDAQPATIDNNISLNK